jgi:hypothetical protein
MSSIERPALIEVQCGDLRWSTTLTPSQLEVATDLLRAALLPVAFALLVASTGSNASGIKCSDLNLGA